MIVAFSTSSPLASVAIYSDRWQLLDAAQETAPRAASAACLRLLDQLLHQSALKEVRAFGADTGPGSFTGVRVGVTLAKTLAFAQGAKCFAATSFDLVSRDKIVVLPSKRGEWFIRRPGAEPFKADALPEEEFVGYGPGIPKELFPNAAAFQESEFVEPELLLPAYLTEPSISKPNKPFRL